MIRLVTIRLVTAAALAAALSVGADRAGAQSLIHYPYCLFTGGDHSGFERCNYPTLQQCLFDRRAEGGVCYSNPYVAPIDPPRRRIYTR
jgi:hypothetical protein